MTRPTPDEYAVEPSLHVELLERCRAGDEAAWRRLFVQQHGFVHRVARRLGTPEAEVDDVVQQTFLVAFRRLASFTEGRITTWLYRITANVVSEHHRRRRRQAALGRLLWRQPEPPPAALESDAPRAEAERMVSAILAGMSPKKREVLALYELEGLTGEAIAELVGCKVETVWSRLHYARQEFARLARRRRLVTEEER